MAETIRKRADIEDRYKWDLTHIYPSDRAWKKAYDKAMKDIARIAAFDGRVAEDPKGAIRTWQELIDEIARCLLPEVIAFYETTEGQEEYAQQLRVRDKANLQGSEEHK